MEEIHDILDQHLSERDSIDPSKIKVLSSGFERSSASEAFVMLTSSVKWTVLTHLKSQPRGQNFKPKTSGPF